MFSNLFDADNKKSEPLDLGPEAISLDLLRAVYRDPTLALTTRMRAAIAALPHEVPRLAVTAQVTDMGVAELLDRRLKRIEQMRLLENKTITGETVVSERAIDPEPQPSTPLPAPLNRLYDKRRYRRI